VSIPPEDDFDEIGGVRFSRWRADVTAGPRIIRGYFLLGSEVIGSTLLTGIVAKAALHFVDEGHPYLAHTVFFGSFAVVVVLASCLLPLYGKSARMRPDLPTPTEGGWHTMVFYGGPSVLPRGIDRGELFFRDGYFCFQGKASAFRLKPGDFDASVPLTSLCEGRPALLRTPSGLSAVKLGVSLRGDNVSDAQSVASALSTWAARPRTKGRSLYPPAGSGFSVDPWFLLLASVSIVTITVFVCFFSLLLLIPTGSPNRVTIVTLGATALCVPIWSWHLLMWIMWQFSRVYDREVQKAIKRAR